MQVKSTTSRLTKKLISRSRDSPSRNLYLLISEPRRLETLHGNAKTMGRSPHNRFCQIPPIDFRVAKAPLGFEFGSGVINEDHASIRNR